MSDLLPLRDMDERELQRERRLDDIRREAELLDSEHNVQGVHVESLDAQKAKVLDPALTPSHKVLEAVRELGSFAKFGLQQSELHAQAFRAEMAEDHPQLQRTEPATELDAGVHQVAHARFAFRGPQVLGHQRECLAQQVHAAAIEDAEIEGRGSSAALEPAL